MLDLQRLKSFPVIAIAAVLASGLLGLLAGSLGGVVSPLNAPAEDFQGLDLSYLTRSSIERAARAPGGNVNNGAGESTPIKPEQPEPEYEPLIPGESDKLELAQSISEAIGSITVTVKDNAGKALPGALLMLLVESGALGWQELVGRGNHQGEGVFVFRSLYPGQYRLVSRTPHYTPEIRELNLTQEEPTHTLELLLNPAEKTTAEIAVKLPDGNFPGHVISQMFLGEPDDFEAMGRFGTPAGTPVRRTLAAGISPTVSRQAVQQTGYFPVQLEVGVRARFILTANEGGAIYRAELQFTAERDINRHEVTLEAIDDGSVNANDGSPRKITTLTLRLRGTGSEPVRFSRVVLQQTPELPYSQKPKRNDGESYSWEGIYSGRWFVVADVLGAHAPFVKELWLGEQLEQDLEVPLSRLKVMVVRETAAAPRNVQLGYQVRLRPKDSGALERTYSGNITGKNSDYIDFVVPVGGYGVRVEPGRNSGALLIDPATQSFTAVAGTEKTLSYRMTPASRLMLRCVDRSGLPLSGVEYLLSRHPKGAIPEEQKGEVRKATPDGRIRFDNAPSGQAYLHLWVGSSDFQRPDRSFVVELPAFGSKDLGNVIVRD